MKILSATNETQGMRENDFCWALEGELVFFVPFECGRGTVDDECGCRRAMAGLSSHRATTTIKVVERPDLTLATYRQLIADGYISQGYVTEDLLASSEVRAWLKDNGDELIAIADHWEAGTVVERRGNLMLLRSGPSAVSRP